MLSWQVQLLDVVKGIMLTPIRRNGHVEILTQWIGKYIGNKVSSKHVPMIFDWTIIMDSLKNWRVASII